MLNISWFAISVKRRFERVTANAVELKGHEVYVPTTKLKLPTASRASEDVPMFPGYVLSRFDPRYRMPILTIPGVLGIVGFNRVPTPIDNGEVENLKQIVSSGLHIAIRPLTVGQTVRVIGGPLVGLTGIVIEIKSVHHFAVSVTLLQRSIVVRLPPEMLERWESPAMSQAGLTEDRSQAAS